jgi:hypothetical protein
LLSPLGRFELGLQKFDFLRKQGHRGRARGRVFVRGWQSARRGRLCAGRLRGAGEGFQASETRGVLFAAACHDFWLFLTPRAIWTQKDVKD